MSTLTETENISAGEPYSQGDVIELIRRHQDEAAPEFGVIINADCDLANNKHDGVIAYLPVYTFDSYLSNFWAKKFLLDQKSALLRKIGTQIGMGTTEEADLVNWLQNEESDVVANDLANQSDLKGKKRDKFVEDVKKLKHCACDGFDHLQRIAKLASFEDQPEQYAGKQIAQAAKQLGDGNLFISELKGKRDLGFVVRLKRIYSLSENQCFRSYAGFLSSGTMSEIAGVRVARFTDPYRFRIAQLFANQFARIGLPDEIMALSAIAIEEVAAKIVRRSDVN